MDSVGAGSVPITGIAGAGAGGAARRTSGSTVGVTGETGRDGAAVSEGWAVSTILTGGAA